MITRSTIRHIAISAWAMPKIGSSLAKNQPAIIPAAARNIRMNQAIDSPLGTEVEEKSESVLPKPRIEGTQQHG
jgi:hypothetical protein